MIVSVLAPNATAARKEAKELSGSSQVHCKRVTYVEGRFLRLWTFSTLLGGH